jgi:hypothetical protein
MVGSNYRLLACEASIPCEYWQHFSHFEMQKTAHRSDIVPALNCFLLTALFMLPAREEKEWKLERIG